MEGKVDLPSTNVVFSNLTPSTVAFRTYVVYGSQARKPCAGKLSVTRVVSCDNRRDERETLAAGSETFQNTIGKNPVDDEKEISTGTTVIFPLRAVTPKREVATSVYAVRCVGVSSKAPDVSSVVVIGLREGSRSRKT